MEKAAASVRNLWIPLHWQPVLFSVIWVQRVSVTDGHCGAPQGSRNWYVLSTVWAVLSLWWNCPFFMPGCAWAQCRRNRKQGGKTALIQTAIPMADEKWGECTKLCEKNFSPCAILLLTNVYFFGTVYIDKKLRNHTECFLKEISVSTICWSRAKAMLYSYNKGG